MSKQEGRGGVMVRGRIATSAALPSSSGLVLSALSQPDATDMVWFSTADTHNALRVPFGQGARTVQTAVTDEASIGEAMAQDPPPDSEVSDDQALKHTVGIQSLPELIHGNPLLRCWEWTEANTLSPGGRSSWWLEEELIRLPIPYHQPHRSKLLEAAVLDAPGAFDRRAVVADLDEKGDTVFHRVVGEPSTESSVSLYLALHAKNLCPRGNRIGSSLALTWPPADLVGSVKGSLG